jgi:hypothetical protein
MADPEAELQEGIMRIRYAIAKWCKVCVEWKPRLCGWCGLVSDVEDGSHVRVGRDLDREYLTQQ